MRSISAWAFATLMTMASGPAEAQAVDPLAPLPQRPRPQPTPMLQPVTVHRAQPTTLQPVYQRQTYTAPTAFDGYKLRLAARARQAGVREATIQAYVPTLTLNRRAMELGQGLRRRR